LSSQNSDAINPSPSISSDNYRQHQSCETTKSEPIIPQNTSDSPVKTAKSQYNSTSHNSFKPITEIATSPVKINSTNYSASQQLTMSAAQIAADLKQKRTAFSNFSRSISENVNQATSNNQLSGSSQNLYNHHTESSLNKQKLKQQQQQATNSNSNNNGNLVNLNSNLKRTPSVCSLLKNNNESSASSLSLSNSSSSSLKSQSKALGVAKSPTKQQIMKDNNLELSAESMSMSSSSTSSSSSSSSTTYSSNHSSAMTSSNLKKASSMLSLIQQQQQQTTQNSKPTSSSKSKKTCTLPPKTIRQVKQRSVDRQGILNNCLLPKQSQQTKSNSESPSNVLFDEKAKSKLRKKSNSVVSLLREDFSDLGQINKLKVTTNSNKSKKTLTEKSLPADFLIIDQLQNATSEPTDDQMSSSSSSQNELDHDHDHLNPLKDHQTEDQYHQTSSNSLTSSSSSSCSLFEVAVSSVVSPSSTNSAQSSLNKNKSLKTLENFNESSSSSSSSSPSSSVAPIGGRARTTTFAQLAAAAGPSNINKAVAATKSNGLVSSHLTREKCEAILKEFQANVNSNFSALFEDVYKLSMRQNNSAIHFLASVNSRQLNRINNKKNINKMSDKDLEIV
jgi:hypothetical protein